MIQGRVMADDSPAGTFDDESATDYQVQCNQDVSLLAATIAVCSMCNGILLYS